MTWEQGANTTLRVDEKLELQGTKKPGFSLKSKSGEKSYLIHSLTPTWTVLWRSSCSSEASGSRTDCFIVQCMIYREDYREPMYARRRWGYEEDTPIIQPKKALSSTRGGHVFTLFLIVALCSTPWGVTDLFCPCTDHILFFFCSFIIDTHTHSINVVKTLYSEYIVHRVFSLKCMWNLTINMHCCNILLLKLLYTIALH